MGERIRWGILSTGHISGKFAEALKRLPEAELCAVASRNRERAAGFARQHDIPRAHGSYAALAEDPGVDVVYIGTPHVFHMENSLLCMRAGKAVLCEKAFAINAREAEEMIRVAREEEVFLMEALVTRHIPLVKKFLEWIRDGRIGEVRMVKASFCKRGTFDSRQRHLNPELGGGSLLDLGVYVISFASMIFGRPPEKVAGFGHVGAQGSDEQGAALLQYDRGEIADLSFALRTNAVNEAYILGTEGHIRVDELFSLPRKASLVIPGKAEEVIEDASTGDGLAFEALEVMRCMRAGLKESPFMTLEGSLQIMHILDRIRAPWGLHYANDLY